MPKTKKPTLDEAVAALLAAIDKEPHEVAQIDVSLRPARARVFFRDRSVKSLGFQGFDK